MPITNNTATGAIEAALKQHLQRAQKVIVRRLAYIGESGINRARECGDYIDRTGNLRSSIGYVVIQDGQVVQIAGFLKTHNGTDKATGESKGRAYAEELARNVGGTAVIFVAGMPYAAYVQDGGSHDPYDVTTSAELEAKRLANKFFK